MNEQEVAQRLARLHEAVDSDDLAACLLERDAIDPADASGAILLAAAEIEVGSHFERAQDIESGLQRLDILLNDETLGSDQRETLRYNRTVALSGLCDLETDPVRKMNCSRSLIRELSDLEEATSQGRLKLQIAVNLGNAYSALRRRMEAIEAWNRAIAIDSHFGMARGNRGIELIHYADFGAHYGLDIAEAWSDLQAALDDERTINTGGLSAVKQFEDERDRVADHAAVHANELQAAMSRPGDTRQSAFPFLSTCAHSWRCDYRFTDSALFRSAVFPLSDAARQERMFRLVNAFKEDFATARYMFESSRAIRGTVDKKTKYIFQTDYSVWGVKYGLMKQCIAQLVSGLDKLAGVLNEYFALGLQSRTVYFLSLFDAGGKELRKADRARLASVPEFSATGIALKSMALDLAEIEPLKRLVDLRHGVTHRAVTVHVEGAAQGADQVAELDLEETVLRTAKIAKHSFLYTMDVIAASSRQQRSSQRTGTLPLQTTWDV